MKIEIKRIVFSFIIALLGYFLFMGLGIHPFITGFWCAFIYELCKNEMYFLIFTTDQKYVIRLAHKINLYDYEWVTSINPNDRNVKSNKKEIALRFDTENDAREILTDLQQNFGPWETYYAEVKPYYN